VQVYITNKLIFSTTTTKSKHVKLFKAFLGCGFGVISKSINDFSLTKQTFLFIVIHVGFKLKTHDNGSKMVIENPFQKSIISVF
jgi:hypothetical protein